MYSNQDNSSSNIRFTPSKDSHFGSNADVGTKPTGNPRSTKDFKKVLKKSEQEYEDPDKKTGKVSEKGETIEEDGVNKVQEDEGKKQDSPLTLFDLTKGKQAHIAAAEAGKEKAVESPSELFSKLSKASRNQTTEETKKEKFTTRFDTEQPDLSYVNPLGLATQASNSIADVQTKRTISASHIQEIIEQMVNSLKTVHDSGKTETLITLKHPPIFEGANIILSAYDSAKGEFNIAFENLTQAAKQLLDLRANQESLRQALEQRGYAVHIVVTTTLIENRILAENANLPDERQREQQEDQQGRGDQGKERQG